MKVGVPDALPLLKLGLLLDLFQFPLSSPRHGLCAQRRAAVIASGMESVHAVGGRAVKGVRPRESHSLSLTARQIDSSLTDLGVESVAEEFTVQAKLCEFERLNDISVMIGTDIVAKKNVLAK